MARGRRVGRTTLLDTNVWSYVSDAHAGVALARAAKRGKRRIVVAPAALYETLRYGNPAPRSERVELMTRRDWKRPMSEAHDECEELMGEVARLHPEWVSSASPSPFEKRLAHDWRRAHGGFWSRARADPGSMSDVVRRLGGSKMERAREDAVTRRRSSLEAGWRFDDAEIDAFRVRMQDTRTGFETEAVAHWRMTGLTYMTAQLGHGRGDSTSRQWISSRLDLRVVGLGNLAWRHFWFHEVEARRMPRHWIRSATELLHSLRKTNDGTPGDSQLATYLVDVDEFVTADRRFHEVVGRCAAEAPFPIAASRLIKPNAAGVDELLEFVGKRVDAERPETALC